ncbi:ataxin-3-like protein [Gossypium australe]|uniref:ubiquitinyl hydrolase 1 n=1 Tax=Gossypium australe TaxID=47621 RepID=A0A5B6V3N6_9ROSI|nr:ataxin-3-like protein [Gossypium australe]
MLCHEVQESKLCAVHCVKTVLQGPFFSEFDLAALASNLDTKERQMMFQGTPPPPVAISSLRIPRMSPRRRFQYPEVWDYQNNPLNCSLAEPAQIDPELENAFICHLHDHWFCIRKVNGEWYNFNSLYTAPEHFSKFYLSAYLDSLKGAGWSVFLVRGNFPKEFHISSTEAFNGYGQWLSPEDVERITKSSNLIQAPPQRNNTQQHPDPLDETDTHMLLDMEDEDLKAAIAASLMDSSPAAAMTEASNPKSENKDSPEKTAKAKKILTCWASDNGSCHVFKSEFNIPEHFQF